MATKINSKYVENLSKDEDSRRKKYGARVAKAIEKWYGEKPYVDPWDPRSTAFFEDRKLKRQNY